MSSLITDKHCVWRPRCLKDIWCVWRRVFFCFCCRVRCQLGLAGPLLEVRSQLGYLEEQRNVPPSAVRLADFYTGQLLSDARFSRRGAREFMIWKKKTEGRKTEMCAILHKLNLKQSTADKKEESFDFHVWLILFLGILALCSSSDLNSHFCEKSYSKSVTFVFRIWGWSATPVLQISNSTLRGFTDMGLTVTQTQWHSWGLCLCLFPALYLNLLLQMPSLSNGKTTDLATGPPFLICSHSHRCRESRRPAVFQKKNNPISNWRGVTVFWSHKSEDNLESRKKGQGYTVSRGIEQISIKNPKIYQRISNGFHLAR